MARAHRTNQGPAKTKGNEVKSEPSPSKTLSISLTMDNAAFGDPDRNEWHQEAARILRDAAKRIENGDEEFQLRDENGNHVGNLFTNTLRNTAKGSL